MRVSQDTQKKELMRGSVAVEFLLTVPAFLIVVFLVIELSLMWADRHIVKLAAYEAARSYLTEDTSQPCAQHTVEPARSEQAQRDRNAKRAAVLKVAATAPSFLWMTSRLGLNIDATNFNRLVTSGGPFAEAFAHLALRIPTAMALTKVECKMDADGAVKATVTYWRAPRMPFVKTVIWATWVLMWVESQLDDAGLGDVVRFELDDMYFGVRAHSPALANVQGQLSSVRQDIETALDSVQGFSGTFDEAGSIVRAIPGMEQISDQYFGTATQELNRAISQARGQIGGAFDQVQGPLDETIRDVQRSIDNQASVVTAMVYAIPDELRLIPMSQTVRLTRPRIENESGDWNGAQAFMVAPFKKQGAGFFDLGVERWRQWAEGMAAHDDSEMNPNPDL